MYPLAQSVFGFSLQLHNLLEENNLEKLSAYTVFSGTLYTTLCPGKNLVQ